jgi:hypothetical protein
MGTRRRTAVRLGIPALIVGALALIALWRVGAPVDREPGATGTSGEVAPLVRIAEVIGGNAVGREASLEDVEIRQLISLRTFWVGHIDDKPAFAVLASNARRRPPGLKLEAGSRVTLIGRVEPAPEPAEARREWEIDESTAQAVRESGVYLLVTEIRQP